MSLMTDAQTDREEFLDLAETISNEMIGLPEEALVIALDWLHDRIVADLSDQMGADAAARAAQAVITALFRRRQQILAPVLH
jgi:hypothetical protein